jgi:hypothetical protein
MQIGTMEGGIEDLEITDSSDLDQSVNRGDWVEVWYRLEQDQSKVMVRSARSTKTKEAETAGTTGKESTEGSREQSSRSETQSVKSTESSGSERSMTAESESGATARERDLGPDKVLVGRPGRMTLPQTASTRPLVGLLGLVALFGAGAALALGRGRA